MEFNEKPIPIKRIGRLIQYRRNKMQLRRADATMSSDKLNLQILTVKLKNYVEKLLRYNYVKYPHSKNIRKKFLYVWEILKILANKSRVTKERKVVDCFVI